MQLTRQTKRRPDSTGLDRPRSVIGRTGFERTAASLGVAAMTLFVVVAALNVGTATAAAGSATTQSTLTECQDITESGTYTLDDDVTDFDSQGHPSKDSCFAITADDVTLQGNGHTIELHETAILVQGDRVTVENVAVERGSGGPLAGIRYQHAADGTVRNNEITDVRTGIDVVNSPTVTVEDNAVDLSGSNGIRIRGSGTRDTVVRNNRITDSGHNGIVVETGAVENEFRGNEISGSARDGIEVTTDDNVLAANALTDNSHSGLSVVTGDGNEVNDNDVRNNRGPGIDFDGSTNNEVVANLIEDNNGDGIYLYNSDGNTISGNDVTTNYDGIELSSSGDNEIRDNLVTDNTENGTYFHSRSDFNGVFHNDVENNREYGIALVDAGGNDFVDNSALDNGKSAFYSAGNGANDAWDLRIGTSRDPVAVGFYDAVSVVVDTTTKPPDGPDPNEWADDSDDSDDTGIGDDQLVETPLLDPEVQTALTDTSRKLAEIMNVSDKAQIHKYVRVRPTSESTQGPASPKLDGLKIYYQDSDRNCNDESDLQIWRYSPGPDSNSPGTWRPNVGEHYRGSSGSEVSLQRFGTIDVQDEKFVELLNHSDTDADLVSFQVVDYHVFAAMSDPKPDCTPTAYTQATEDEGSPGFGIAVTVLAVLVVLSRRLIDGS